MNGSGLESGERHSFECPNCYIRSTVYGDGRRAHCACGDWTLIGAQWVRDPIIVTPGQQPRLDIVRDQPATRSQIPMIDYGQGWTDWRPLSARVFAWFLRLARRSGA